MLLLEYNPLTHEFRSGSVFDALMHNRDDIMKHATCPWVAVGWCEGVDDTILLVRNLGLKYNITSDTPEEGSGTDDDPNANIL
jgi:hypothetical protein